MNRPKFTFGKIQLNVRKEPEAESTPQPIDDASTSGKQ